jgi:L-arabinose isomerase
LLISHMGEGNWRIAREDRPVRLIDRELGIGRLDNPPTLVFSARPGPATTAALVPVRGEHFRLLVGRGEVLDTPELPKVEMHYFHFRPRGGMESFMDSWLRHGGPHHFVTNLGDHTRRWRRFAEQLQLELVEL